MSLLKNFSIKLKNEDSAATGKELPTVPSEEIEDVVALPKSNMDSLDSKLINVVREIIESREMLRHQVDEREKESFDRKLKIDEQRQEMEFYGKKVENMNKEILKLQEMVQDQKLQNEQLSNDYSAYRTQQEQQAQDMQERLTERELSNRQLMIDLNRGQKDYELKLRDMEKRERELHVKFQHLEEKHKQALSENARLVSIINDFASQATLVTGREKKVD